MVWLAYHDLKISKSIYTVNKGGEKKKKIWKGSELNLPATSHPMGSIMSIHTKRSL